MIHLVADGVLASIEGVGGGRKLVGDDTIARCREAKVKVRVVLHGSNVMDVPGSMADIRHLGSVLAWRHSRAVAEVENYC